ncbi:hypothetical protein [Stutzerimonas stutzeri]|uniref:Uncharacterized protein n=1 Tax=Stutzerimonas stutzeri TaxID=316 RepID=A0A6I6LRN2_STUST|nr:hypothetical protein [Stutzerimonas stutzeri]QGZ31983.1 hypothetical protein GQA94_18725 [Stutzerimonas stutzeri]
MPPLRRSPSRISTRFYTDIHAHSVVHGLIADHAGMHNPAIDPRGDTMSKGMDSKKNAKKKPQKTAQQKRLAKREKASGESLLGSHAAR